MWFLAFTYQGGCSKLFFRSLFQMEVQENPLHNVFREAEILSKGWFWWLIRGMMRSLEVSKVAKNSS